MRRRGTTLIIFPAQVVHAVSPYNGERPRITLSWNIGAKAVPQEPPASHPNRST